MSKSCRKDKKAHVYKVETCKLKAHEATIKELNVKDVHVTGNLIVDGSQYIPVAQGPFDSIIPSVDLKGKVIV